MWIIVLRLLVDMIFNVCLVENVNWIVLLNGV